MISNLLLFLELPTLIAWPGIFPFASCLFVHLNTSSSSSSFHPTFPSFFSHFLLHQPFVRLFVSLHTSFPSSPLTHPHTHSIPVTYLFTYFLNIMHKTTRISPNYPEELIMKVVYEQVYHTYTTRPGMDVVLDFNYYHY